MKNGYAENFYEIIETLELRSDILELIKKLIKEKEIVGKALEGNSRKEEFRKILLKLVNGEITLQESYEMVEKKLDRATSIYKDSNRVFAKGWGERLIRTNLSKFYNQAILLEITESGDSRCFIPHSNYEKPDSPCNSIAGKENDAERLLVLLVETYEENNYTNQVKIPNHPHCTHVVMPLE